MDRTGESQRHATKTRESYLRQKLEEEFDFPPRIAQAVLEEAQACLSGQGEVLQAGQMWVYLAKREAGHGKTVAQTALLAVRWTVDAGREDQAVVVRHGREALRRVRIQRLVDEAVELHQAGFTDGEVAHLTQQGLVLVQEYLAIYQRNDAPAHRRRLAEQIVRFQRADAQGQTAKGGDTMSSQAYVGSQQRTFQAAFIHEMEQNYGFLKSKRLLTLLATDVQRLVEEFYPMPQHLRPGWILFTGTKAEGPKTFPGQTASELTAVTLAWPLVTPEDLAWMITQPDTKPKRRQLLIQRLIRLIEHGRTHVQGPVLLTVADLSLLLGLTTVEVSHLLQEARTQSGQPLHTKGYYYFDQGLRPSHKDEIIALYEKGMDEADIARHSYHAQSSVGRYLRDYERVKELITAHIPVADIPRLLGLQPSVVEAYVVLLLLLIIRCVRAMPKKSCAQRLSTTTASCISIC